MKRLDLGWDLFSPLLLFSLKKINKLTIGQ